jgi:hypothetical protein
MTASLKIWENDMQLLTYQQVVRPEAHDEIRHRYRSDIDRLEWLGFEELCFYSEVLFPFSAILAFPLVLFMLVKREIVKLGFPLRAVIHYPLLVSREYNTYVEIFSMGVKFYTNFADGTALVSANFKASGSSNEERKFHKYASKREIETAWAFHQDKIRHCISSGRQIRDNVCFEDYVEISTRDDAATLPGWRTHEKIRYERVENLWDFVVNVSFFSLILQPSKAELGTVASCTIMMGLALVLWLIHELLLSKEFKITHSFSKVGISLVGAAVLSVVLGARDLALSASGGFALIIVSVMLSNLLAFIQRRICGERMY